VSLITMLHSAPTLHADCATITSSGTWVQFAVLGDGSDVILILSESETPPQAEQRWNITSLPSVTAGDGYDYAVQVRCCRYLDVKTVQINRM
jgi:hypothetical protein